MSQPSRLVSSVSMLSLGNEIPLPDFDFEPSEVSIPAKGNKLQRAKSENFKFHPPYALPIMKTQSIIPRITPQTLSSVVRGDYDDDFDEKFIVDCRFPYEYQGGHIKNAINCKSPSELFNQFFEKPKKRVLVVFHCEFSKNRAPQIAELFRNHDRSHAWSNDSQYQALCYSNVFILDGGFNAFFESFRDQCVGDYVPMYAAEYIENGEIKHCNSLLIGEIEKAGRCVANSKFKNARCSSKTNKMGEKARSNLLSPLSCRKFHL